MWQQYNLRIKGQRLHSGTPQLPSDRFLKNCEKSAQELDLGASCCTMTMPLPMPPIWQWIFWGGLPCSCCPILLTVQTWYLGDFFLFPTVKARLHGKRFLTLEDTVTVYQGELCALDESDWHQCLESWFSESTLRKCNGKFSIIVLNCCVSKNFLSDPRSTKRQCWHSTQTQRTHNTKTQCSHSTKTQCSHSTKNAMLT